MKAAYATFSAIHVHEGGATFSEHGFSMAFSIPDKAETLLLAAMMADLYRASAERRKCDLQKLSQSLRINCSRVFSAFEHTQKSNVSQCTRVFIYIYTHFFTMALMVQLRKQLAAKYRAMGLPAIPDNQKVSALVKEFLQTASVAQLLGRSLPSEAHPLANHWVSSHSHWSFCFL